MPRATVSLIGIVHELLTIGAQGTFSAFGRTGSADIPSEQDDAVTEITALLRRQDVPQLPLHLLRILALGQAQAIGNANTMGIADHRRLMIQVAQQ